MAEVMRYLNERLPANAVVTTGAGNASDWPNIYYAYRSFRCALSPICGAMGFGVPAAVAAKLASPERIVVYIGGDGDFLMNGQELATAVQYGADPVFVIIDNGMYGTIRMHQEQRHPGRVFGTLLQNPDFATVARGYGAHGELVETTQEFAPAFERAVGSGKAAVIHVKVGPDSFGPNLSFADVRPARDTT
jgi:acetolactate synthase-1/2/3 large subunit